MLKMLASIRTHLHNESVGLGTKAMDHFDNSAWDWGWVQRAPINPWEPQTANKVVVAHYDLTLLNSTSDFPGVEKFTKLHWEMTISRCRFGNSSPEAKLKASFQRRDSSEMGKRLQQHFLHKGSGLETKIAGVRSLVLCHSSLKHHRVTGHERHLLSRADTYFCFWLL